jgi:hypothetical protein
VVSFRGCSEVHITMETCAFLCVRSVYNFDGCLGFICLFAKLGVLSFTFVMRRLIGSSKLATNAYEVCSVLSCAIASVNYAFREMYCIHSRCHVDSLGKKSRE